MDLANQENHTCRSSGIQTCGLLILNASCQFPIFNLLSGFSEAVCRRIDLENTAFSSNSENAYEFYGTASLL